MKTPCKIIEDLLPMYYDGICSRESSDLIEAHLKECPHCTNILSRLKGELELPEAHPRDDLKPLEQIQNQIKREKKRSVKKGVIITLSFLAAVFLLWTSVWYFGYGIYYDILSKPLSKITDHAADMTTADHTLEAGSHRIILKHPGFLGEGGFIHVGDKEGMVIFMDENYNVIGQNKEIWIDLFFYPHFGGGYRFALMLDNGTTTQWVWLTPELTVYRETDASNTPEELQEIERILKENHSEITALFDTVKDIWGIEYLTVD